MQSNDTLRNIFGAALETQLHTSLQFENETCVARLILTPCDHADRDPNVPVCSACYHASCFSACVHYAYRRVTNSRGELIKAQRISRPTADCIANLALTFAIASGQFDGKA